MPIDVSPGSFAAVTITALFWWTVLSPAGLLAVAVLCASRPALRAVLTIVVLAPPVVTLLPVAVMHGGPAAIAAAAAVLVAGAGIVLATASVPRARRAPERSEQYSTASLLLGVAGGMIGSVALLGSLLLN
jgi:hypothetical protein